MSEAVVHAYRFGTFTFEARNRRLTRDGQPVALKPKTALLLLVLLEAGGKAVSRQESDSRVWPDATVGREALFFQVHLLRRALGEGDGKKYIETVPGAGYRMALPIEVVPAVVSELQSPAEPKMLEAAAAPMSAEPAPIPTVGGERTQPGSRAWVLGVSAAALMLAALLAAAGLLSSPPVPRISGYHQLTHDGRNKDAGRPMLADASRVYFYDTLDDAPLAVALAGGEIVRTRTPGPDWRITDVDRAGGEYLALHRDPPEPSGLPWIVSATNGQRRRVGEARCEQAAWSPDRRTIACATGASLVSIDVSRGTSTSLAKLPGRATWLRWAPDGQTLRFSVDTKADRAVSQRLWEVRGDGTGLHALLPGWRPEAQVCCGGWSPDGRYFVFQVRDGARSDLWVLREGRSALGRRVDQEPVQLTSGPMRYSAPLWSSDGKQILAIGVQVRGELVRYDLSVGEFVPYLPNLSATSVTFSPDRRRVAYATYPEKTLWSARADGTDPRQLTLPPLEVDGLTWSPDSARLAFRGTQPGGRPGVYVASADGGRSELVGGPATAIGVPSWSADGRILAVGEVPDVFGNAMGTEVIHTYDVVTRTWASVPGSAGLWAPHWSPDGRYLAALSIRGQRLWLLDLVTGSWRPLEADRLNSPTWSGDSRYVYYDTEGVGPFLRRVRISDGRVEQLQDLRPLSRAAYWWTGLSHDDAPLVLRDVGSLEVYALDVALD